VATAANEARWRAGAASVLSEAVGAADARSASSGSGVEGVAGGCVGAAGTGLSATRGVAVGTGVGQLPFATPHDVDSHRVPENAEYPAWARTTPSSSQNCLLVS